VERQANGKAELHFVTKNSGVARRSYGQQIEAFGAQLCALILGSKYVADLVELGDKQLTIK
jgi:hypothetical protein